MKKNGYILKPISFRFVSLLTIAVALSMITSCSFDPLDKTYNKHSAEEDYKRIREISSIDSADALLLGKHMIDHGLVGAHVLELHATYKDILNEAKKEKEKYEIERRKKGKNEMDIAKSHNLEKLKNLRKVLLVDFVKEESTESASLGFKKSPKPAAEDKNLISFNVMFKNVGDKGIQAFKGEINFYDVFHTEIKKITFTNFKQIGVGDSIVQKFTLNLNEINKSSTAYNDLKKDFIKAEWLPDRLIQDDDTVIE